MIIRDTGRLLAATLCLLGINAATGLGADPTNQWASFQNSGRLVSSTPLPTKWTPESLSWTAVIEGYGQSSPLAFEESVYVTSTSGGNKEQYHLACLALGTGEKQWQVNFSNPSPEKNSTYVSRAAPTPVVDKDGCYVFFEGGVLASVDHTGTVRWQRNLVEEFGAIKARHGLAASLEQDTAHVFVWVEREASPYVAALSKQTGEVVWKVDGVGATSWSSPRLVDVGDSQHLVCSAIGKIVGYSAAEGKRLWEFTDVANNSSCTPVPTGDKRFLIGASDGRGEEASGKGADSNGLVELSQDDNGQWTATLKWHATKATSSFGSPIATQDSAYFVNRSGVLFQCDLETGKESKPKRIASGSIWATPIVADNKLYLFGQKGTTSVIDLTSGEEIAQNQTWAKPQEAPKPGAFGGDVLYAGTMAGSYLLIRKGNRVFAIR